MGAERKSQYLDPDAKLATAYHEVCQTFLLFKIFANFLCRVDMPLSPSLQMEQCLYTRSHAFPVVMLWDT
jgi:hypothetical protein